MYGQNLLSTIFLILPTLSLACNFTKIDPITHVEKPLQLTIYTTGIETRRFMNKPPNVTTLPQELVYKKEAKPGVVDGFSLLYPDGMNYTFNMYIDGPKNISFAYSFFEVFNGKVNKSDCVITRYPYKLNQAQDHVYFKLGTSHKKTSYILKFKVEEMESSESYRLVAQSFLVLLTAFFVNCNVVY
eukprot:TCONS_00007298-protein